LSIAGDNNIILPFIESNVVRLSLIPIIIVLLLTASLPACGNKGPLYHPEEDKVKDKKDQPQE